MGVENKTKNKKKDEMNVKKFKKRRRRLPRLYPHTLSLNWAARLKKKELFVSRVWRFCIALKVNLSLSSLESDGRLVAEGSLALYRNFTISRQGFSITLGRPNIFSFLSIERTLMHATAETHTHTHARVCVSPAGVQKKRMQIKQSVFFYTIPNGKRLKYFFYFLVCDLLNRLIKN